MHRAHMGVPPSDRPASWGFRLWARRLTSRLPNEAFTRTFYSPAASSVCEPAHVGRQISHDVARLPGTGRRDNTVGSLPAHALTLPGMGATADLTAALMNR